jgi:hypothetical protein
MVFNATFNNISVMSWRVLRPHDQIVRTKNVVITMIIKDRVTRTPLNDELRTKLDIYIFIKVTWSANCVVFPLN